MDKTYLELAIEEAKKSNSKHGYHVGAVIVKNSRVLSTGHTGKGKPYIDKKEHYMHAEEYAISACQESLAGATMYVTMEPCTARRCGAKSCCDWIIDAGITKIVFGVLDPEIYINCHGAEKIQEAGIEIYQLKELEQCCKELTPALFFS